MSKKVYRGTIQKIMSKNQGTRRRLTLPAMYAAALRCLLSADKAAR
jgi:hypothetical protein